MERLKHMKESLMNCVSSKMGDLSSVDTGELGAAIDMIKDLEEAIYYKTITESMEQSSKKEKESRYYVPEYGRMYYGDGRSDSGSSSSSSTGSNGGSRYYREPREYPIEIRDYREGNSPISRRMYMESKEMHKDKNMRMKELEKYMHELTDDIKEMIEDASPEEKQMLQEKISTLAHKIV